MRQLKIKKEIKTLTVKIGDRILLIKIQELVYIDAEEKYVFLNTVDGKRNLTDFTITSLAEKLQINLSESTEVQLSILI